MKLSVRKIFSIIIASLALFLFINSFLPYRTYYSYGLISSSENLWGYSVSFGIFTFLCVAGIITVYLLHIFGILKEKWINFANYAVGYISLFHISLLFKLMGDTHIGIWLGTIVALAILVLSVLWYFVSDEAKAKNEAPITGYDAKTGKPIYAKQKGFDPHTGKPIYEEK